MNNFDISVSIWIVILATVLRLWAAKNFIFVIRRALQETNVKNGLEKLRRQLLTNAIILLFINTSGLSLLLVRPFASTDIYLFLTNALTIINSFGFYWDSRIKTQMYKQQYTIEQKELHAKIDKLEKTRIKLNKDRRAETRRNKI